MFGDVGRLQPVCGVGGEPLVHQVVVHRWPGPSGQALLLREHRPDLLLSAQPRDPVQSGRDAMGRRFIGDEPISERGVVAMDVERGVDQVGVVEIAAGERAAFQAE